MRMSAQIAILALSIAVAGMIGYALAPREAPGSILKIDPDNNLIIVMTRDRHGHNYDVHSKLFVETVADCVIDPIRSVD